jgi:hypothetical protein
MVVAVIYRVWGHMYQVTIKGIETLEPAIEYTDLRAAEHYAQQLLKKYCPHSEALAQVIDGAGHILWSQSCGKR